MNLDIIIVTYNSQKWLDKCILSIIHNKYDKKKVSLIFYDNHSKDNTIKILNKYQKMYQNLFDNFIIIKGSKNKGFGYGNNQASKYGKSPYIFFLNADTSLPNNTLKNLQYEIEISDPTFAMWELAQRPYEHPRYYDPITQEVSWASAACMVVKRDVFEKIKGFDTEIFMYCEDVEISWHLRQVGYKIKYLYNIPIMHYHNINDFNLLAYIGSWNNNFYLRAKYGHFKNYLRGIQYMTRISFNKKYLPSNIDKKTKKKIVYSTRKIFFIKTIKYGFINLFRKKNGFKPQFINGLDYELSKENPLFVQSDFKCDALVSIIVRTTGRLSIKETLESISKQTYKNIEVVVVQDGENTIEKIIKKEFNNLNINFYATQQKVGRCKVGNIGLEMAKGKYINFLDDDDVFYPDHVETLVKFLEEHQVNIAYTSSFETLINITSLKPYNYEVKGLKLFGFEFNRFLLYKHNLFPILSVMFTKEAYKNCGGLDENFEMLEDWDFWIRLSLKYNFYKIKHTTSCFRTPYDNEIRNERNEWFKKSLSYFEQKFKTYEVKPTVYDYYMEDKQ